VPNGGHAGWCEASGAVIGGESGVLRASPADNDARVTHLQGQTKYWVRPRNDETAPVGPSRLNAQPDAPADTLT
jgi:hypothetical protein